MGVSDDRYQGFWCIPQRRQRVFLIASLEQHPAEILFGNDQQDNWWTDHRGRACGFYWTEGTRGLGWAVDAIPTLKVDRDSVSPHPSHLDARRNHWDT